MSIGWISFHTSGPMWSVTSNARDHRQPTFLPPSALATSDAQFTEQYDQWMAKRLHMTVEELRESRARARARDAKEAAASECGIEIVE